MGSPMSDWFMPVPHSFESAVYAAKFQQESLASLIHFYKQKCMQQRIFIERLQAELVDHKALKKTVEDLRRENQRLQKYADYHGQNEESSRSANGNGKRPMIEIQRQPNGTKTNSSPRSIVTPVGPSRLTLAPDHHPSNFGSSRSGGPFSDNTPQNPFNTQHFRPQQPTERPGSSRFAEQYAYVPSSEPQLHAPTLSHAQGAPIRQSQARQAQPFGQMHPQNRKQQVPMPPPPNIPGQSSKFKPSLAGPSQDRLQMPPPPTPQNTGHRRPSHSTQSRLPADEPQVAMPSIRRFVPPTPTNPNRFTSASQDHSHQPFVPQTPSGGNQRFLPAHSNPPQAGPSRSASRAQALPSGGGQRKPFIPSGQSDDGFG
ncbi:hypothetical protein JAAARDRAFT_204795 [Jaapia argillacea MUCL 33604]|uniref:Uncharacterized protein n=1 Tax=Jaapia argillacea MUCL 33604 TaxID=933084 RepID=A0A067Q244_9AGAM|nr:hypothetical protein JAAARDRAFT_204795 [Jaapia argillacea MUCL 33604]